MDKCFCKHRTGKVLEEDEDFRIAALPCFEEDGEFDGMCIAVKDKTDGYCLCFAPKYCPFCGEKIRDVWDFNFT